MGDTEEITSHLADRRQHYKSAGMRVLFENRIIGIAETGFISQLFDGSLAAGQKMPALRRARPPVAFEVSTLLGRGQRRGLVGIDAHANHVEFLADAPFHLLQSFDQAVEDQRAEHRAFVIAEHENHRLLAAVVAELSFGARFINEA